MKKEKTLNRGLIREWWFWAFVLCWITLGYYVAAKKSLCRASHEIQYQNDLKIVQQAPCNEEWQTYSGRLDCHAAKLGTNREHVEAAINLCFWGSLTDTFHSVFNSWISIGIILFSAYVVVNRIHQYYASTEMEKIRVKEMRELFQRLDPERSRLRIGRSPVRYRPTSHGPLIEEIN